MFCQSPYALTIIENDREGSVKPHGVKQDSQRRIATTMQCAILLYHMQRVVDVHSCLALQSILLGNFRQLLTSAQLEAPLVLASQQ